MRKDEFDYETLKTVIKQSHLYKDVSELLSDYSIEISEVSIEPDVHLIFPFPEISLPLQIRTISLT